MAARTAMEWRLLWRYLLPPWRACPSLGTFASSICATPWATSAQHRAVRSDQPVTAWLAIVPARASYIPEDFTARPIPRVRPVWKVWYPYRMAAKKKPSVGTDEQLVVAARTCFELLDARPVTGYTEICQSTTAVGICGAGLSGLPGRYPCANAALVGEPFCAGPCVPLWRFDV